MMTPDTDEDYHLHPLLVKEVLIKFTKNSKRTQILTCPAHCFFNNSQPIFI